MKLSMAALDRYLERFYAGRWRQVMGREQREREDLLMLLLFGEALGIPNPAGWYTLELRGPLLEEFHRWHQRQGLEKSPLEDFRCC